MGRKRFTLDKNSEKWICICINMVLFALITHFTFFVVVLILLYFNVTHLYWITMAKGRKCSWAVCVRVFCRHMRLMVWVMQQPDFKRHNQVKRNSGPFQGLGRMTKTILVISASNTDLHYSCLSLSRFSYVYNLMFGLNRKFKIVFMETLDLFSI